MIELEKVRDDVGSIVKLIREQYSEFENDLTCDKTKVIVLARTNSVIDMIKDQSGFKKGDAVWFGTVHRAKGLQGETAVVCEDFSYDSHHPIRHRAYVCAGMGQTYDEAISDEMGRLAYVAITRGVRRVYWFVSETDKGRSTIFKNRAS